jgi:hypothetical protein
VRRHFILPMAFEPMNRAPTTASVAGGTQCASMVPWLHSLTRVGLATTAQTSSGAASISTLIELLGMSRPMRAIITPKPAARRAPSQRSRYTRADVLAAAARMFVTHGWAGSTIVGIAKEADVAVETVYRVRLEAGLAAGGHGCRRRR